MIAWYTLKIDPLYLVDALALYYLGDLKVTEVAMAMKISEGTVKSYLDRARETLRKTLETPHGL